jgi:hypothetical protein
MSTTIGYSSVRCISLLSDRRDQDAQSVRLRIFGGTGDVSIKDEMQESVADIMTHRRRLVEMVNRFEKGSFGHDLVPSPGFREEALGPHQEHRERIQNKLREFLSAQEARKTATHVYNLVLDIDEEIGRILKDP